MKFLPKILYIMMSAIILSTISVDAAQTADTIDVRADVVPTCVITSAQDIDFGTIAPNQQPEHDAQGNIAWRCTRLAFVTLALDGGSTNGAVNNRSMLHADGSELPYQLYRNAARTSVWGSNFFSRRWGIGFGLGIPRNYAVYARIQDTDVVGKSTGAYADTITVTMTF